MEAIRRAKTTREEKKMSKLDEEINNTASDVLEDMRVSLCELQAVIDEIKQRVNYREETNNAD